MARRNQYRILEMLKMNWKPDPLLRLILVGVAFTLLVIWLPFVRGLMDGETYQWGHSFFQWGYGGSGVGGAYWLIVLQAFFALALVYFGWRGARPPFHWLLLLWTIPSACDAT